MYPSKICYLTILPFCCGFLVYVSFLAGSVIKNLPDNAGDTEDVGLILGLGRSPGGGNGTHSSILAWKIPWREEPGGLQSMEAQSQTQLSTHKF